MLLKTLSLQNYRSFAKKELAFDPKITIIVGKNTAGKTNVLEAINLLATGKSFRAATESEVIKQGEDLARVIGNMETLEGNDPTSHESSLGVNIDKLEIVVTRGEINGAKVPRKKLTINGNPKRFYDFVGTLKTVMFSPQDLDLISGSPSIRRKFLDNVCSLTDREYRRSLLSYEKGLRQRNRLLQRIREREAKVSQLLFWNQLLIKNGEYITRVRENFIEFANGTDSLNEEQLSIYYDKSIISPARLEQYSAQEIMAGTTLVGPQRDDIEFKSQNLKVESEEKNLAMYGSRGEQRMGVLWLKLAELEYIDKKTGSRPLLLLDDVFSELDEVHREIVMNVIGKQQTVITTADPHTLDNHETFGRVINF